MVLLVAIAPIHVSPARVVIEVVPVSVCKLETLLLVAVLSKKPEVSKPEYSRMVANAYWQFESLSLLISVNVIVMGVDALETTTPAHISASIPL